MRRLRDRVSRLSQRIGWLRWPALSLAVCLGLLVLASSQLAWRVVRDGQVVAGADQGYVYFVFHDSSAANANGLFQSEWDLVSYRQYLPSVATKVVPTFQEIPAASSGAGSMLAVPVALPALVAACVAAFLWGTRRPPSRSGQCAYCGYPSADPTRQSRVCPECGKAPETLPTIKAPRFRLLNSPWGWSALATMLVVASVDSSSVATQLLCKQRWSVTLGNGELRVAWSGHPESRFPQPSTFLDFSRTRLSIPSLHMRWRPVHLAFNPWPAMSPIHTLAMPLWIPLIVASGVAAYLVGRRATLVTP